MVQIGKERPNKTGSKVRRLIHRNIIVLSMKSSFKRRLCLDVAINCQLGLQSVRRNQMQITRGS